MPSSLTLSSLAERHAEVWMLTVAAIITGRTQDSLGVTQGIPEHSGHFHCYGFILGSH